jgi:acetate kinase
MREAIVVLNAGSSSLKFSVYAVDEPSPDLVVRGQIEGLATSARFNAKDAQGRTLAESSDGLTSGPAGQRDAFGFLLRWLRQHYQGQLKVIGVGHRVVHGGGEFAEPTRVSAEVMRRLESFIPLAPLHQPHNLAAIRELATLQPELPQVACFDTAFHQGRARVTERFGLPQELFQRGLRRWGFHGLSYESIARSFGQLAPELAGGRVIAAHLAAA